MSARQIIVLAVAFILAIAALLIIRGMGGNDEAPAPAEPVAGIQVLVAAQDVAQGAPLDAPDLAWRAFPEESVTESYIRADFSPEAIGEYTGAVTRRPFIAGEPILMGSVVQPEGRGQMAAMLQPGYRAVSIEIEPMAAAGGFIGPNDHVDVLVATKQNNGRGDQFVRSQIVLYDVRVLAVGDRTQPSDPSAEGPEPTDAEIVTLELSSSDVRTLQMAEQGGRIVLALRGVENEPPGTRAPSARRGEFEQTSRPVMIHSFGVAQEGGAR